MRADPTHPEERELEFSYITDEIYIGTNVCCQAHFDEKLASEGMTEDISLEEERVDTPFGVNSYLWLPVKDKTPPNPDQMEYGVASLQKLISLGKKVYVHCKNGHGRAPTLVAAYIMRTKGLTTDEAIAFIKERRPSIHPEDSQKEALDTYFSSQANNS